MSEPTPITINGIDIVETAYNHPDDPPGMHTNGPMSIWVRVPRGEWVPTYCRRLHEVRWWCEAFGPDYVKHLEEQQ